MSVFWIERGGPSFTQVSKSGSNARHSNELVTKKSLNKTLKTLLLWSIFERLWNNSIEEEKHLHKFFLRNYWGWPPRSLSWNYPQWISHVDPVFALLHAFSIWLNVRWLHVLRYARMRWWIIGACHLSMLGNEAHFLGERLLEQK